MFENSKEKELKGTWQEEFAHEGYVFDFRVGYSLIEVQGDFFHSNPSTRFSSCTSVIQIKNKKRDIKKKKTIEQDEKFEMIEIWELDINENIDKIKKIISCLKI